MRLTGMLALLMICCSAGSATWGNDQEVVLLVRQLDSGSVDEKSKAARELGEIGPAASDAIPSLIKSLEIDNPGLRYEAAVALGQINSEPKEVVPALVALLSDTLPLVQYSAIDALRRFGPDAIFAAAPLKALLNDKDPLIGVSAARALVTIESGNAENIALAKPILAAGLKQERQDVSTDAIEGLAMIGPAAVPDILEILGGTNAVASAHACDALAAIGPGAAPAVDKLLAASKSPTPRLRWHAISALGDLGPVAKPAIPALIAALADSEPQVHFHAEQALQRMGKLAIPALIESLKPEKLQLRVLPIISAIGPDAKEAVPALTGLLRSKNAESRREVILALASIGPDARGTSPDLIKALGEKEFAHRPAAAFALGKIGSKEAIPAIKEALKTPNNHVLRLACVWSLLQLDPSNPEYAALALPELIEAMENEKPEIRREAARALGKMGSGARSAVGTLQQRLRDKDYETRRASLIALAEIGADSEPAVEEIALIFNQGEPSLRPIACYALGRIGNPAKSEVPRIRRMLQSRNGHEKTVAAWSLVQIAPDAETVDTAIPLLAAGLAHAENPDVRVAMAQALGKVGGTSPIAKEALNAALKDQNEAVRKAAEAATKTAR
jgi:HEAT repeat protein